MCSELQNSRYIAYKIIACRTGAPDPYPVKEDLLLQPPDGVLIATAEEFSRRNLVGMLHRCNMREIKACLSGEQVSAAMSHSSKKWKLLIMDNRLPGAMDTLRDLRIQFGQALKIMLVFASPNKDEVLRAIEGGTDEILTYPFSQATLEGKVNKLLGNGHPAPAPLSRT